ncbi:MAG: dienelactone hydrolase family protein [Planctomycetes bacterium]|nr:dienelactone hydrolase family protein [Planctomycetota bacterium]
MHRTVVPILLLALTTSLHAQERIKPAKARGGKTFGEPWAGVPELYRKIQPPVWKPPTNLDTWKKDRGKVRATLLKCLGDLPKRPDPRRVKVVSTEKKDGYTYHAIEFYNGVDQIVTGVVLVPDGIDRKRPAVILAHGHSGSTDVLMVNEKGGQGGGPTLARKGYIVAGIDSYFCGKRVGKGPAGARETKPPTDEFSLFKYHLLMGRCLWGMMIRDQQCLIDYLESRPEVNPKQIGISGMSMGCTTSWWTAALDERIQSTVGVACFTRYTELFAHGNLKNHGIYYFVPGVWKHFDTEAIHALIAPRAHLELSGDEDQGAPIDGVITLEKKLAPVYRLYDQPKNFHSIVYEKTGHEYLPEMREQMVRWFERTLPVRK